jgi:hypothetical protein
MIPSIAANEKGAANMATPWSLGVGLNQGPFMQVLTALL